MVEALGVEEDADEGIGGGAGGGQDILDQGKRRGRHLLRGVKDVSTTSNEGVLAYEMLMLYDLPRFPKRFFL